MRQVKKKYPSSDDGQFAIGAKKAAGLHCVLRLNWASDARASRTALHQVGQILRLSNE